MDDLVVLSPHGAAAQAVGGGAVVTGAGRAAVTGAVASLLGSVPAGLPAVAVTGTSTAAALPPGQVVVADEVCGPGIAHRLPAATLLAEELRRDGVDVVVGPVTTEGGPGLATDDDSAWALAALPAGTPVAVVRAVEGPGALAALGRLRPALEHWARAVGDRRLVLAAPRSFCAGVERAIEIVERAIDRFGAPVYVRRQIVHNAHVVADLAGRGAVFVQELDEVPDGATVVLAAHGVTPAVRAQAGERDLQVVDATCPLVAKVHHEARRFAAHGYEIALIGHGDHEEVEGTLGEAPMHLVESVADVEGLAVPGGKPVAYLTQTTLATDETAEIVGALRRRYPGLVGPSSDDICYATQNRQDAVRAMAGQCDLVLVVGSANSSNTARLVEVARREGARAELVEDARQLRLDWLDGAGTVGLTAGASVPEVLVQEVIDALGRLGRLDVDEHRTTEESVRFALPLQVR